MYKLQKIKRKNLDVEKYSNALNNSLNYRIYAEHWYLDILTNKQWECWIYGDYEVIMPVPLQYKFGIKFVIQPTYCQQLGVFYKEKISEGLFREFENKLHKYRVRSYSFNEENTERYNPKGDKKVNYILDLSLSFDELRKNLSKSSKWNLKQFEKSKFEVNQDEDLNSLVSFKKNQSSFKIKTKTFENLSNTLNSLSANNLLLSKSVKENNSLIAYACFIYSKNRIIYINSSSDEKGKKICAPTGILIDVMKTHLQKGYLLDFEGSSIPNLSSFFRGFGASEKFYTNFSNFR